MKLVYVTASLPYGPGETFIIPEIRELMAQGNDVLIVPRSPRGDFVHDGAKALESATRGEPLVSFRILAAASRTVLCKPRRALRALRWMLRGRTPRIIIKNLAVYPKGLWLAEVASRWGAQHIHAHWASTTASMAMVASEVSRITWSFTAHRWDIVEDNLLSEKARHATFARFISESGLGLAVKRGVPQHKALVLHMGVRLPIPQNAPDAGPERPFRLFCPASLLPVKGHSYLIEALAKLDADTELWLAGEGPLRKQLEAQAIRLGLQDRVRFLGRLRHEALLRVYEEHQVDAVILPSIDLGGGLHEGIPVALMEAMAYGLPVVSTATGGIPELLDGGAGLLVPPKDSGALASAITRLRTDPQLRHQLAEYGRRRVENEFAVEKVVARLAAHFSNASVRYSKAAATRALR